MLNLTVREQKVLVLVIFLLLTGLAVKSYRTAHSFHSGDAGAAAEGAVERTD